MLGDGTGNGVTVTVKVISDGNTIAQGSFQASTDATTLFQQNDAISQSSMEELGMDGRGVQMQLSKLGGDRDGGL